MSNYKIETNCIQAGYEPGNGEAVSYTHLSSSSMRSSVRFNSFCRLRSLAWASFCSCQSSLEPEEEAGEEISAG